MRVFDAASFERLLHELTGFDAPLDGDVVAAIDGLIASLGASPPASRSEVARRFYGRINEKLDANREVRRLLYREAAAAGYTFNYPQKKTIARAIDQGDIEGLESSLRRFGVSPGRAIGLARGCEPVSQEQTRRLLHGETERPSKLRKALQRSVKEDVFASCAGPLVWALWQPSDLYRAFGGGGSGTTARDYMRYLESLRPELFNRGRTLTVKYVTPLDERETRRHDISKWLASEYKALANHGFLAMVVDASRDGAAAWATVNDATLFAERFLEVPLRQMFFRSEEVMKETLAHATDLDAAEARFDLLNEGFTYRDVFVLTDAQGAVQRLVLVMQKNARDETKIPCPACRGTSTEGNSYPTFGVRSWECRNPLCPNRSIYNRGNRFQFRSIVQQAAIEDPRNTIPVESVNRWRRDVLAFISDAEIAETMIAHYSIADDGVAILGLAEADSLDGKGRKITTEDPDGVEPPEFWSSAFFRRFMPSPAIDTRPAERAPIEVESFVVVEGDSTQVLATFPDNTFDRAVTSPPYYNAREYAQWSNLYCYLHDMYVNSAEVYRTLKPGAVYAYNIFDYFDNERIVTFSAMGRKRIPLGALMAHVFEAIGFELLGVIPWDKGEIHGKRGFNGGNYSPYYQSPFNCWEHVLVVRKPGGSNSGESFPSETLARVAKIPPVIKMVRGENTHGHTAPFPEALAQLLLTDLPADSLVLDPYAGSGTTARAAFSRGCRTVLIERDAEYAALATRLTEARIRHEKEALF